MDNNNIIDIVPEKWNTEQDTEQTEKPKKPFELFGIIDALFVDKEKIYNLSDETCKQYLFMVLRRLAIKYPLQANHFNDGKSNPKHVAADLLSQAEHDKMASAVLVTDSYDFASCVSCELEKQIPELPRC